MPEEEQQPEPSRPEAPKRPGARRRGRRGGRGRRRPPLVSEPVEPAEETEFPLNPEVPANESPAMAPPEISEPPRDKEKEFAGSGISRAVAEVTEIVESLRQTLAQMEDVLELVELAERQKLADEREIESLRRTLRKIHHPRG